MTLMVDFAQLPSDDSQMRLSVLHAVDVSTSYAFSNMGSLRIECFASTVNSTVPFEGKAMLSTAVFVLLSFFRGAGMKVVFRS